MTQTLDRSASVRPWFAVAGLVLACSFWGIGFPLTKAFAIRAQLLVPSASSWFIVSVMMFGRFALSTLLLLLVERRRPTHLEWEQGLLLGLVTGAGTAFQIDGMTLTAASTSAFLTQGYVVVLPIVAAISARCWPNWRVIVAVFTIVFGLSILAEFSPRTLRLGRGEAETLVAAMFFSLQILTLARRKYAANRTGPISVVFFGTIALGSLPLVAVTGPMRALGPLVDSTELWLLFLALAVLGTLTPFWLMNRCQPFVPPAEAGIIYGFEPLFASLFALFVPELVTSVGTHFYANEQVTRRLLIGGALVTLANLLLQLPFARRTASERAN